MRLLVTGGAGFIGSHYVRLVLHERPEDSVVVLDKLTYAGNLRNLEDVAQSPRYAFVRGDICDAALVHEVMSGVDAVVNFAAETHVDRSLMEPASFIETDVKGTYTLLEAAKAHGVGRFLQVSTDEVYGSIDEGSFRETDILSPSSPYSASKAGGEMMVMAYHTTYGMDTVITRGSNNYGPYQYPEKLIPLFITNALDGQRLPLYGDGANVRDWIFAPDHCRGIDLALRQGAPGEVYNVGGGNERTNRWITGQILGLLGKDESLITRVADRPGHDRRYSIATEKIRALGWAPEKSFEAGLAETVAWYQTRRDWWEPLKSGEYRAYYQTMYADRLGKA
ncbi:MAG TPA: dTDP-glucose 4,6-dehydratase [Armatimonadota bacterium]|jgi:dTDP-glucose 4,6-dehydratase